jgi:hypothetical protein
MWSETNTNEPEIHFVCRNRNFLCFRWALEQILQLSTDLLLLAAKQYSSVNYIAKKFKACYISDALTTSLFIIIGINGFLDTVHHSIFYQH